VKDGVDFEGRLETRKRLTKLQKWWLWHDEITYTFSGCFVA